MLGANAFGWAYPAQGYAGITTPPGPTLTYTPARRGGMRR